MVLRFTSVGAFGNYDYFIQVPDFLNPIENDCRRQMNVPVATAPILTIVRSRLPVE